jgi:non-canonical poly(A) RNA polymerase PAPD5/7
MSTKPSPKSANSDRRSKKRSDRKRRSDTTKPTKPEPVPPLTADLGDDFVPFVFSDSEEEPQEANPVVEEGPPQREWDKDKKRADKKRGAYDANDGYANKKQRLDAASRRCPWVLDVEWEKCNNVAEM